MARDGAAIELQRQMATESIVPRTDAEVAQTTLKRIAECKGARSRNVHQPIPGASQQAHRIAAIRLNLGLVEPSQRSEEHTSELQSLMRISDDVFCLKKKKTT